MAAGCVNNCAPWVSRWWHPEAESIGAVTTIALAENGIDSEQMGRALDSLGFCTSYASGYLRERNWLQICLLGEVTRPQLERLLPVLAAQMDALTRVQTG